MVLFKQILCPIDFSEFSRHAFDRAVSIARCYDAGISVLHVLPLPAVVHTVPFGPEGGPFGAEVVDRHRVLAEFPKFLALEQPIGAPVTYHVVEAKSPHNVIHREAAKLSADLIVMGTHGRSGFERVLLGSVTEKVLRTSPVPVLTVPPHAPDVVPAGRDPFKRILYATDFSPGSEHALRFAASLAEHAAAQLILLHAVEPLAVGYDPIPVMAFDVTAYNAALADAAAGRLRAFVPEALRLGCDTDDVVTSGRPYVEILRVAAERQVDLIVLGIHGRSALDRLVFGSTTEHVLRRATCPVLTVREYETAGA
jgi:nucleotide-binding universal stress UspA family protein